MTPPMAEESTAINPRPEWVTDQQLNPWDEPVHYVLSGDLTTAAPDEGETPEPTSAKGA